MAVIVNNTAHVIFAGDVKCIPFLPVRNVDIETLKSRFPEIAVLIARGDLTETSDDTEKCCDETKPAAAKNTDARKTNSKKKV